MRVTDQCSTLGTDFILLYLTMMIIPFFWLPLIVLVILIVICAFFALMKDEQALPLCAIPTYIVAFICIIYYGIRGIMYLINHIQITF